MGPAKASKYCCWSELPRTRPPTIQRVRASTASCNDCVFERV